jgi:hypothetical protein
MYSIEDIKGDELGYLELTEYSGSHIINIFLEFNPEDGIGASRAQGILRSAAQELIPGWSKSGADMGGWILRTALSDSHEEEIRFGDALGKLSWYDGSAYKLRIETQI